MKVLVACEESQRVCLAFRQLGHEAYSCDILPPSGGHPEYHIQDDVRYHILPNGHRMSEWYYRAWADPKHRAEIRSKTFPGIAAAMADQWG